jgi:hypothetical protein
VQYDGSICLAYRPFVFGEARLRRILGKYAAYYNASRIHRSLNKDAPFHRAIERVGAITSHPRPRGSSSSILQNLIFGTHTDPAQYQRMFNPARDRMVGLSAIGQSPKDHYDALAPPMPPGTAPFWSSFTR